MPGLDQLPQPIILCIDAAAPVWRTAAGWENDLIVTCALCEAPVRMYPARYGECTPVCLTCFLVHAEDVPTC
jgi:hypothetical protein